MHNKFTHLVLILLGSAFLFGALSFWIDIQTSTESVGLAQSIQGWLMTFLTFATFGLEYLNLKKKDNDQTKSHSDTQILGGTPQISQGEHAKNIQAGRDYIEKLEVFVVKDDEDVFQLEKLQKKQTKAKAFTPFLIGMLFDLSRETFDSIYKLSEQENDFSQRITKMLNKWINKALAYCKHPHSKEVLPKFSLFFYGYGFGKALKGGDSWIRRLGIVSDSEPPAESPIRDLLELSASNEDLPITPNAADLNKYWKIYSKHLHAQYFDMEDAYAPLIESLTVVLGRFQYELRNNKFQSPLLLLITSGKITDGSYKDLLNASEALKKEGITVCVGYIGKHDIQEARTLYNRENPKWSNEAKALFSCASELDPKGKIGKSIKDLAVEKSWKIPERAKLFLQVNHHEMLDELIDLTIHHLRD